MLRTLAIALAVVICFSYAVKAEEPDPKKMPAVKKALEKAEVGVRKNRKAYNEANEKVFAEAEKTLLAEVDRLSKAGKPEEAVAVKKVVELLRKELASQPDGKPPTPPVPPPPSPPVPRPEQTNVVFFNGHRYSIFLENLSWEDAKAKCEKAGGHLLIIEDGREQEFIRKSLRSFLEANAKLEGFPLVWLGVRKDIEKGTWVTLGGVPQTYLNWHPQAPGKDDSVAVYKCHNGFWLGNNGQMADDIFFICEWDR